MPWQVARESYGCAPEVTCAGDLQSTIPYIPTHLDYMLYELLKNAMRCASELSNILVCFFHLLRACELFVSMAMVIQGKSQFMRGHVAHLCCACSYFSYWAVAHGS